MVDVLLLLFGQASVRSRTYRHENKDERGTEAGDNDMFENIRRQRLKGAARAKTSMQCGACVSHMQKRTGDTLRQCQSVGTGRWMGGRVEERTGM